MEEFPSLGDGRIGDYVILPSGQRLLITSCEVLKSIVPYGGPTQYFYQLGPEIDDRYLEVSVDGIGVISVRLTQGCPRPPGFDQALGQINTLTFDGANFNFSVQGVGKLSINGAPVGMVNWVRLVGLLAQGVGAPPRKVITVMQEVDNGEMTFYKGIILPKEAVRIVRHMR